MENDIIRINISEDLVGKRLDKVVFDVVSNNYSRTQVQKLIDEEYIVVNGESKPAN